MKRRITRKRTTTIKVNGETWKVPRGFGVTYKRTASAMVGKTLKPGVVIDDVIDMFLLVGYRPTRDAVANWPLRKRVEAIIWCTNEYFRASDNPVQRHPDLEWLRGIAPWTGPYEAISRGFAGATPTEIRA